jgi:hypothetical protein
MLRSVLIVPVLILCSSCASEQQPSVSGKFALTAADVRAIQRLVEARPDIRKPVRGIYVDRRDHAQVNSGTPTRRVGSGSFFTVAKRHGQWVIASPIQEEHIIVEAQ